MLRLASILFVMLLFLCVGLGAGFYHHKAIESTRTETTVQLRCENVDLLYYTSLYHEYAIGVGTARMLAEVCINKGYISPMDVPPELVPPSYLPEDVPPWEPEEWGEENDGRV